MAAPIPFDNTYVKLPEVFYTRQHPTPVKSPGLIKINHQLAVELGIDAEWLQSQQGIETCAGNYIPESAEPISTVYAGHQFGGWNPQLGDGRAVLLGELIGSNNQRYDIQLKGSGQTPYSRNGDGRAPLGPVLREYILSEAMAALGVPSTRSLAAVMTGEPVFREEVLPGAVLTRVASSHIRIGTFQYFAAMGDVESVRALYMHAAQRHYPETLEAENPACAFLDAVINRQAELVAKWQLLGFIHGVMNTDNILISGETIDYGPCAFMDAYHPETVYSSIDHQGRYAYVTQPRIAHWNLSWLAQSLIPILDSDQEKAIAMAQELIDQFPEKYHRAYDLGLAHKLGFAESNSEIKALGNDLLGLMASEHVDFTLCFHKLADLSAPEEQPDVPEDLFQLPDSFDDWLSTWAELLDRMETNYSSRQLRMRSVNPLYVPRNHLVEDAINRAQNDNDFVLFHKLIDLLAMPYEYQPGMEPYAKPPKPDQMVRQTFCGT